MSHHDENNEAEERRLFGPERPNMAVQPVQDRFYSSYLMFYALGVLGMVPHNFFITANDYWMYKFRDPSAPFNSSSEDRTKLQTQFTSNFSIVSTVTSMAFIVVTMILAKRISLKVRMVGCMITMVLMFIVTIVFVAINTDNHQKAFYIWTLITGCILNASGSIFLISSFHLVSKFPASYLGAQLSGQAICGIFSALIQIVSLGIGASSQTNATIYFGIGMFCVILTAVFYVFINYSTFFQYHANKEDETPNKKISLDDVKVVMKKIKFLLLTMVLVISCSVMLHPGLTSLVVSVGSGSRWNELFFVPVSTYLFYNLFDFIGRELSTKILKPQSDLVMILVSVIRFSLIPLIMFCNVQPRHHLSNSIHSDSAYIIFIILLSFSHGFIMNLCILKIPTVTTEEQKPIAMLLMIVFMISSIGLFSFFNILIIKAV